VLTAVTGLGIVFILAIAAVLLALPIMLAARIVGAENTGFGSAVVAAIGSTIVAYVAGLVVENQAAQVAVIAVLNAVVFAAVLGTGFLRGLTAAVVVTIIWLVIIKALAPKAPPDESSTETSSVVTPVEWPQAV
jgi:MFS family permease